MCLRCLTKRKLFPLLGFVLVLQLPSNAAIAQGTVTSSVDDGTGEISEPVPDIDVERAVREIMQPRIPEAGLIRSKGLAAPDTGVIKLVLWDFEQYRAELSPGDFQKVEKAQLAMTGKNYITSEIVNSCRSLLALKGNYPSKPDLAGQIAEELIAMDRSESEHVAKVFSDLLSTVSSPARDFLVSEKTRRHNRISSVREDYRYTSIIDPDYMIERRESFCSRI